MVLASYWSYLSILP